MIQPCNAVDSFFTASGKKDFSHRIIVSTALHWTENAEKSLENQHPPVSKIDLHDLETSQIDWKQYHAQNPVVLREKKSLRPHQQRALKSVVKGLATAERGKMIMACGYGQNVYQLKNSRSRCRTG